MRSTSLFVSAFLLILAIAAAPSGAAVKGQYIAKMYTEGLGRLPEQTAWINNINTFASQGCNATTLRNLGIGVYTSAEFNNLGYDNAAKLLALYRGALNREPASTEYNNNLTLLNTGTSWTTMVNNFFMGSEFANKVSSMCNSANYGFGGVPFYPIAIPTSGSGFIGNEDQLQALINSTPSGGTVWLAQKAVIYLYQPLILKTGVTLATTGSPNVSRYASMARLVRNFNFNDAMVRLLPGSKLKSVWVDGQKKHSGLQLRRRQRSALGRQRNRSEQLPLGEHLRRHRHESIGLSRGASLREQYPCEQSG